MKRIAVLHINLKELPPNFRPRRDVVRLQVPIWSAGTRVELPIDLAVEIKSKAKVSLEGDEQRELLKRLANRGEDEDEKEEPHLKVMKAADPVKEEFEKFEAAPGGAARATEVVVSSPEPELPGPGPPPLITQWPETKEVERPGPPPLITQWPETKEVEATAAATPTLAGLGATAGGVGLAGDGEPVPATQPSRADDDYDKGNDEGAPEATQVECATNAVSFSNILQRYLNVAAQPAQQRYHDAVDVTDTLPS